MNINDSILAALKRKPLRRTDLDAILTEQGWDKRLIARALGHLLEVGKVHAYTDNTFSLEGWRNPPKQWRAQRLRRLKSSARAQPRG